MIKAREVVLYTKERNCAACLEAKRFLSDNGVDYVEKDVENDRDNLMELVRQYRIMSVPVLVVDQTPLKGFDKREYMKVLGLS